MLKLLSSSSAVMQFPGHSGCAPPTRVDRTEMGESSDTDAEPPAAPQVLSFVVDDPGFENKEADKLKMEKVRSCDKTSPGVTSDQTHDPRNA